MRTKGEVETETKIYSVTAYKIFVRRTLEESYPNADEKKIEGLLDFAMDNFHNGQMYNKGALKV